MNMDDMSPTQRAIYEQMNPEERLKVQAYEADKPIAIEEHRCVTAEANGCGGPVDFDSAYTWCDEEGIDYPPIDMLEQLVAFHAITGFCPGCYLRHSMTFLKSMQRMQQARAASPFN